MKLVRSQSWNRTEASSSPSVALKKNRAGHSVENRFRKNRANSKGILRWQNYINLPRRRHTITYNDRGRPTSRCNAAEVVTPVLKEHSNETVMGTRGQR